MQIQINTDKNVSFNEELRDSLNTIISKELSRYKDHITRLEVHLSDQDGSKHGHSDKRCMIEARPGGLQPIAATDDAATYEKAVTGAIHKLITILEKTIGRMRKL